MNQLINFRNLSSDGEGEEGEGEGEEEEDDVNRPRDGTAQKLFVKSALAMGRLPIMWESELIGNLYRLDYYIWFLGGFVLKNAKISYF